MKSRKIVYLLPNLESGGTERHALTLARLIDRSRFALSLVTTAGGGALYDQFQALLPLTVFGETAQGRRFRRGWVLERDPRGDGSGLPVVASRAGGNPETVEGRRDRGSRPTRGSCLSRVGDSPAVAKLGTCREDGKDGPPECPGAILRRGDGSRHRALVRNLIDRRRELT
jgi:hypothetical protein